jgi:hypothetical protein
MRKQSLKKQKKVTKDRPMERTKAELLKEIEFLKSMLEASNEGKEIITLGSLKIIANHNKAVRRYYAKMHNLDRIFSKQMQICLLLVLLANTILLVLRWM